MSGSAARVLVVDGAAGVLRIAEAVLSEAGYHVACCTPGDQLVADALRAEPQVILLDHGGEGGVAAMCRALGDAPGLADVPIVLMAHHGHPPTERFARELGIVDHVRKPFSPQALLAVVEHTLRRPEQQRRPNPTARPTARAAQRLAGEIAEAIGQHDSDVVEHIGRVLDAQGTGNLIRELYFERSDSPALSGELSVVPIADVLQMLSLQRQSGFLRVARGSAAISIALENGVVRLVTGEDLPDEFRLGNILLREGSMTADELDVLLKNRRGTRQRLGSQVVKLGYLETEQLHRALHRQSSELVYELLRWSTGRYTFSPERELPAAVLEFEFDLTTDELLMEGFRRVDDWGLIEEALPHFDAPLRTVPGGLTHVGPQGLTPEEEAVLHLVDDRRTANDVIATVAAGTYPTARLLYRLVAARVIRVG